MSGIGKSTFGQRAISEMLKDETLNSDFRCVLSRTIFLLQRSTILRFFKCVNLE